MVSQAWHAVTNLRLCAPTFGLEIQIVGAISAWRFCKCEANSSKKLAKLQTCPPFWWQLINRSSFPVVPSPIFFIFRVWLVAVVPSITLTLPWSGAPPVFCVEWVLLPQNGYLVEWWSQWPLKPNWDVYSSQQATWSPSVIFVSSCGIRQSRTPMSRNMRQENGRRFPVAYTFVC